jgi:hypothetical protein
MCVKFSKLVMGSGWADVNGDIPLTRSTGPSLRPTCPLAERRAAAVKDAAALAAAPGGAGAQRP